MDNSGSIIFNLKQLRGVTHIPTSVIVIILTQFILQTRVPDSFALLKIAGLDDYAHARVEV